MKTTSLDEARLYIENMKLAYDYDPKGNIPENICNEAIWLLNRVLTVLDSVTQVSQH